MCFRFCKCDLAAKHNDLITHSKSAKHISASEPFSTNRQKKINFPEKSNDLAKAEISMALFVSAHCAISNSDHMTELCRTAFHDSKIASNVKMHRTKCSEIIKGDLCTHFKDELLSDIGNGPFSLLLDESNDVSVTKLLGIAIIYYSSKHGNIISTFLHLAELTECNAQAIVDALHDTLAKFGLNIQNLRGIGTDNASVMVGINNGVYAKLKEEVPHLILIRCVCHSLQLAVSHATAQILPRHLEFLIQETYNWFSKSAIRQSTYENLYKAINDGQEPLKIPQVNNNFL